MIKEENVVDFLALQIGVLALFGGYQEASEPEVEAKQLTELQAGQVAHELFGISCKPGLREECGRLARKLDAVYPKTETHLRVAQILKLHEQPFLLMQKALQWMAEVRGDDDFNAKLSSMMYSMLNRGVGNHSGSLIHAYMTADPKRMQRVKKL